MCRVRLIIKSSLVLFFVLFISHIALAGTVTATDSATISAVVPLGPGNSTQASLDGGYVTSVTFSGFAYPGAIVHVWKDGTQKGLTMADKTGYFSITFNELYNPALYTLYAIDRYGRQSLLLNYPIVVKRGYVTEVSGILFSPTISTDKTEVKQNDYITVNGYAKPNQDLDLYIQGSQNTIFHLTSAADGTYAINVPLLGLPKGRYNMYIKYKNDPRISKVVQFTIAEVNLSHSELTNNIPGDCDANEVINLVDFSIMAYWYGRPNPPRCVDTNNDNVINLTDFSILAFYWTG